MQFGLFAAELTVERAGRVVLRDVSFQVASGESLVLTGPNGAGKTTLLRSIAGFLPLVGGKLHLIGGDDERELGEQCHYIGHANAVKTNLTVTENLEFWRQYLGGDGARVRAALDALALGELGHVRTGLLSAGQRRRVGLARLMVAHRPLWLLDEPTVSLDAASVALLADVIGKHCAAGGLVIAATHLQLGITNASELSLVPAREDMR